MRTKYLIPKFLIIFLLLCTTAFASKEETTQGKVMQVKVGDTIVISPAIVNQFFTCRLYGIDTPEIPHGKTGQPYGEEATKALKQLILGQVVEVTTTGQKTNQRKWGHIPFNFTSAPLSGRI